MNFDKLEKEILRQQLYDVFHIQKEDHITTVKLLRIYRWVEKSAGPNSLEVIHALYLDNPHRKKMAKLDDLFRIAQSIEMRHLSAPTHASVPKSPYLIGIRKW